MLEEAGYPPHSRYHRRLSDLPVSGYPVKLLVEVRRFFCQNPSCSRKTFAEALLPLARRYAQRTNRLQTPLQPLGLALGAQAGARVSVHLGLASSPSSLLHNLTESVSPLFPRIRAELAPSLPPTKENALSSPQGARQQQYRDLLAFSQQGLGPEMKKNNRTSPPSDKTVPLPKESIISFKRLDKWCAYAKGRDLISGFRRVMGVRSQSCKALLQGFNGIKRQFKPGYRCPLAMASWRVMSID